MTDQLKKSSIAIARKAAAMEKKGESSDEFFVNTFHWVCELDVPQDVRNEVFHLVDSEYQRVITKSSDSDEGRL